MAHTLDEAGRSADTPLSLSIGLGKVINFTRKFAGSETHELHFPQTPRQQQQQQRQQAQQQHGENAQNIAR